MDIEKLTEFFDKHKVLTLAYSDNVGPGAAAVWYAQNKEFTIFYLSSTSTRHGAALKNGGNVAFTIHKDDQKWDTIQGIQGRGYTKIIEKQKAWDVYTNKFSFIHDQFDTLENALSQTKLWQIRPNWLRLIDNTVEFGYKEEIKLM